MIDAPAPGSPYVLNVCEPSDFHRRWKESRFRVSFSQTAGPKSIFRLKNAIRRGGMLLVRIEALAESPMDPIDFRKSGNTVLCRMLDAQDRASEWMLAILAPDIEEGERESLLPDWLGARNERE